MSTAAGLSAAPAKRGGFRRFWRALQQLFYELAGAAFAILAFAWLNAALRAWTRDVALWLIGIAVAVALLFSFFAVTSFLRARKL